MARRKIGVMLDSLQMSARQGILKAAELGLDAVQLTVSHGELAPEELDRSARRELRTFVANSGLAISALCVELGGYTDAEPLDERIVRTQRMIDLGVDLGVAIHTAHIGRVPEDPAAPERRTLADALSAICTYAAERECCLAAETGPEDTPLLHDFLASIGSPGARANFDPANLVMNGFDPVRGVYELADFIVHVHAKDAVRHDDGTPEEVPLGEGQVDWDRALQALRDTGYAGTLTIERETSHDPLGDIARARRVLERLQS